MHGRRFRVFWVTVGIISLLIGFQPGLARAEEPILQRAISVSITYLPEHVYGGRLVNSKAAFTLLAKFLDSTTVIRSRVYSFIDDVLGGMFRQGDGFVWTAYGYAYGTCGAASLLNELI